MTGSIYGSDRVGCDDWHVRQRCEPYCQRRTAMLDATTNLWWDGSSFDRASQTCIPVRSGTVKSVATLQSGALMTGDGYMSSRRPALRRPDQPIGTVRNAVPRSCSRYANATHVVQGFDPDDAVATGMFLMSDVFVYDRADKRLI